MALQTLFSLFNCSKISEEHFVHLSSSLLLCFCIVSLSSFRTFLLISPFFSCLQQHATPSAMVDQCMLGLQQQLLLTDLCVTNKRQLENKSLSTNWWKWLMQLWVLFFFFEKKNKLLISFNSDHGKCRLMASLSCCDVCVVDALTDYDPGWRCSHYW